MRAEIMQWNTVQSALLTVAFGLAGAVAAMHSHFQSLGIGDAVLSLSFSALGYLWFDADNAIQTVAIYLNRHLRRKIQGLVQDTQVLEWENYIRGFSQVAKLPPHGWILLKQGWIFLALSMFYFALPLWQFRNLAKPKVFAPLEVVAFTALSYLCSITFRRRKWEP